MIVCLCTGLSDRGIRELAGAGATTVSDVAGACGAGADCGACRRMLEALLDDTRRRTGAGAGMAR